MRKSIHSAAYKIFLDGLVKAREARGTTQTELAKRLGITQSWVSKVERGERRLDVVELHTWCEALGCSFSSFCRSLEAKLDE